jgi:phage terminase large subunit-like protein
MMPMLALAQTGLNRQTRLQTARLLAEKLRRQARTNSAAWGAHYRGITPGPQQWQMAARGDDESILYQADFWPRDHGKTEIFVHDLPLRKICEDPNIRVLIVQKTATEARKVVSVIKTELEENARLRSDYAAHWQKTAGVSDIVNKAGMVDDKTGAWGTQRLYVKRARRSKDPTVEAVGVGGAITGGHFDVIICDDVLDDENTKTEDRCHNIINWFFGTIMQLREPHTKIIVVGTLKTMLENLYSVIQENPMWNMVIYPAILSHNLDDIQYTPITEIKDGREQIVDVVVHTPDVQVMWPAKWPIEALILDMLGSPRRIWRREKMNDLAAMAEQIFKRGYFRYYDPGDPPHFRRVLQSWDTAFKETAGAAYSVMSEWGQATAGAFLRDVFRQKLEWSELSIAIPLLYLTAPIRPDAVLIEDKASGQSAIQEWSRGKDREAWIIELRRYQNQPGAKRVLTRMIEDILTRGDLPRTIHVPVLPIQIGSEANKEMRAEDASVWYANGQVWHPELEKLPPDKREMLEAFEGELTIFPNGRYRDQVDTTSQLILHLFGREQNYASGKA